VPDYSESQRDISRVIYLASERDGEKITSDGVAWETLSIVAHAVSHKVDKSNLVGAIWTQASTNPIWRIGLI